MISRSHSSYAASTPSYQPKATPQTTATTPTNSANAASNVGSAPSHVSGTQEDEFGAPLFSTSDAENAKIMAVVNDSGWAQYVLAPLSSPPVPPIHTTFVKI
jgi:hypothetical protein